MNVASHIYSLGNDLHFFGACIAIDVSTMASLQRRQELTLPVGTSIGGVKIRVSRMQVKFLANMVPEVNPNESERARSLLHVGALSLALR